MGPVSYNQISVHQTNTGEVTSWLCYPQTGKFCDSTIRSGLVAKPAQQQRTKLCGLLVMANLVEPPWVLVNCSTKITFTTVCFQNEVLSNRTKVNRTTQLLSFCGNCQIALGTKCIAFETKYSRIMCHTRQREVKVDLKLPVSNIYRHMHLDSEIQQLFYSLLSVVSHNFSLVIIPGNKSSSRMIVVERMLNLYLVHASNINHTHENLSTDNLLIKWESARSFLHHKNIFLCHFGGYISVAHVCDDSSDCPRDDSDETNCVCKNFTKKNSQLCKTMLESNSTAAKCGPLFYQTFTGKCVPYKTKTIKIQTEPCDNNKSLLLGNNHLKIWEQHSNGKLLPGMLAASCFQMWQICIFELNRQGELSPCKNGGHMQNCTNFVCHKHFKCPEAYCIP